MKFVVLILGFILAKTAFSAPAAKPKVKHRRDIPGATSGGDATLIGGTPADPAQWPASVYASMSGASCSATIISDRTLLIAAHCVANNGTATFTVLGNRYSSKCTHHPEYKGNATADWTLCLTDKVVTGVPYENVNKEAGLVKVGETLQLTGYGCTRPGGGGNDGVFRIGEAKVVEVAQPAQGDYDIVTRGAAALCYGDSGGAAYKWLDSAKTKRVIVGVNSRGDIATTSYLPDYATASFWNWASAWETKNAQKICVLGSGQKGCRYADSQPDPEPKPFKCQTQLDAIVSSTAALSACVKAP